MACGLPIITTKTGGAEELIKNNGFIVKQKSAESLANAINQFIKDRINITEMGKKSREIAEKMSWSSVTNSYHRLYQQLTT